MRLPGDGPTQLIERDRELAVIDAALEGSRRGSGQTVLIRGDAGVGKSSLLAEARRRAEALGFRVLRVRGSELERDFSFSAIAALIDQGTARTGGAISAAPIRRLLGLDAGGGRPLEASYELLDACYRVIEEVGEDGPVLIAVDDAQWLDAMSLRAVAYIARRLEGLPVALILSRRTHTAAAEPALRHLEATDGVQPVDLVPLSRAGFLELAESLGLGTTALDEEERELLFAATGGSPFLIRQAAHDARVGADRPGVLSGAHAGRIARRRLDAISPTALAVARAVAVLGDQPPIAHAAAVAGLDAEAVADAGTELAEVGLFSPTEALCFAHPLLAQAVAMAAGANANAALHLRAARTLREIGAAQDLVAAQLMRCPPAGDERAISDLRAAARNARGRAAPEVAVKLLRRALEEAPPPALRKRIQADCGSAQLAASDPAGARHTLRFALEDPELPVTDAVNACLAVAGDGELVLAVETLAAASRRYAPARADDALLLAGVAQSFNWFLPDGQKVPVDLPSAGELAGATPGERAALAGLAITDLRRVGARHEVLRDACVRALGLGTLDRDNDLGYALGPLFCLLLCDDLEQTEHELAAIERGRVNGRPGALPVLWMPRITTHLMAGRLSAAITDSTAFLEAMTENVTTGGLTGVTLALWAHGALLTALIDHDGPAAAEAYLNAAGLDGVISPATPYLHAVRAYVHLGNGRPQEALRDAQAWRDYIEPRGDWIAPIEYHAIEALALLGTGQREEANRVARRELQRALDWGAPARVAAQLRILARTDPEVAGTALEEALSLVQDSPIRTELARVLLDLGILRRRAGNRTEARKLLERAVQTATEIQAHALARQGIDELRVIGARPRRLMFAGLDSLTASERRVAEMAAGGSSNRDIAQHLWVTTKTVESHLSRVYAKLDITSRRDLPSALSLVEAPTERTAAE